MVYDFTNPIYILLMILLFGTILLLGIFPTATAQVLEQVPLVNIPGAIP